MTRPGVRLAHRTLYVAMPLVLALVVAGCGGSATSSLSASEAADATPTAASVPEPTPEVTPTPEPTIDLGAVGLAYLAAADRFNPVLAASLSALADPNNTEEDRVGLYLEIVTAFDQVIADFDAIDWPTAIEADVAGMRAAFIAIRDDFELAADLPNHDPLPVYEEQVAIYKQFADKVRAYLGLPPRPTNPPA